jgi:hypothetical protein
MAIVPPGRGQCVWQYRKGFAIKKMVNNEPFKGFTIHPFTY